MMQMMAYADRPLYVGVCDCNGEDILLSSDPKEECEECGAWVDLMPLTQLPSGGQKQREFLKHNAALIMMETLAIRYGSSFKPPTEFALGVESLT